MKNDPARGPWTHADVEKKVRRGLVDGIAKPRRSAVEQMATKHSNGDLGYLECSLTGAELAELEIRPPEWLIEGVMERGSITLVQGQYKAFKTFTAYGFAESLCRGTAFVEYPVRAIDCTMQRPEVASLPPTVQPPICPGRRHHEEVCGAIPCTGMS